MSGGFVSGGIQKSVLQQRQEDAKAGIISTKQYETDKTQQTNKSAVYEKKLQLAAELLAKSKTNLMVVSANEKIQERRAEYDTRLDYNQKIATKINKYHKETHEDRKKSEFEKYKERYNIKSEKSEQVEKSDQVKIEKISRSNSKSQSREKSKSKEKSRERSRVKSSSEDESDRKRSRKRSRSRDRDRKRTRSKDRKRKHKSRRDSKERRKKSKKKHKRSRSNSPSDNEKKEKIKSEQPEGPVVSRINYGKPGKYGRGTPAQLYLAGKISTDGTISNQGKKLELRGEDFEKYGDLAVKALEAHKKYKDTDGYVTASSGFRYIPRDPNAPIPHAEVKGWLHCWCQTKDFDKPVYELTEEGKIPYIKYTVKLTIKTKAGVELDIKPVVVANSKKLACAQAAWAFVEEMLNRGLLQPSHAPPKPDFANIGPGSGLGEVTGIDISPEATREGGGWTLTNCILRLRRFCGAIKAPLDIQLNAYGPDHDRKTDAHCCIKFQVRGEAEIREYKCSHTTRNRKQAQAAVALTMMRALFKDGFIEAFRKPMKRPPYVIFSQSKSGMLAEATEEELKEINETFGGWIPSNSQMALLNVLRNWDISNEALSCECTGRTGKEQFLCFKSEIRITLVMTTQAQLTTRHELFAYGRDRSKKEAKDNCASMMMRQLFKFGIVLNSTHSVNKPGPNAHMWELRPGPVGAPYTTQDIYVTNKLNEFRPAPDELAHPSTILSHIESALKCVSDWVHEEEKKIGYSHALNNKRTLLGMQRVGPLAMDLMLTGERRAHVVVTSSRRPTNKLLELIAGKSIQMLLYTEKGFTNYNKRMAELRAYHEKMDQLELEKLAQEEALKAEQAEAEAKEKKELEEEQDALMGNDGKEEEIDPEEREKLAREKAIATFKRNMEMKQKNKEAEEERIEIKKEAMEGIKETDENIKEEIKDDAPKEKIEIKDEEIEEAIRKRKAKRINVEDMPNYKELRDEFLKTKLAPKNENKVEIIDLEKEFPDYKAPDLKETWEKADATYIDASSQDPAKLGNKPISKRPDPDYYKISVEPQNSGYLITYGIMVPNKMIVRVTLTSNVLRGDSNLKKQEKLAAKAKLLAMADTKDEAPDFKKVKTEAGLKSLKKEAKNEDDNKVITEAPGSDDEKNENENAQLGLNDENYDKHDPSNPKNDEFQNESHLDKTDLAAASATANVKTEAKLTRAQIKQQYGVPKINPLECMKKIKNEFKLESRDPSAGWKALGALMPTETDYSRFKFGPYFKSMTLEECEIIEYEGGRLPAQPGLGALAELRRIKWYQHVGLHTPYLPDICRLVRGLAVRENSWKPFRILCPWTIALILENLIRYEIKNNANTAITLSPARALKLVLEAIAKGFRFPVIKEDQVSTLSGGIVGSKAGKSNKRYTHKLVDPCEAGNDADALTHVSSSKKSDIRSCAKFALDLLNTEKCCLLMNTEEIEGLEI